MGASARYRAERGAWFVFYRKGEKRWSQRIPTGPGAENLARVIAAEFNLEQEDRVERDATLYPGGPAPFKTVAQAWWDAKSPSMPNSSVSAKHPVVFDRLIPYWKQTDVRRINDDSVRACAVHWIESRKHARETVETTGSILDSILSWAVRRGFASNCPALRFCGGQGVRSTFREVAVARGSVRGRIDAWAHQEAAQLIEAAAARGPWLGDPVLFASQTGCRRGEILALEWGDVDLERGRATIRQSHTRGQVKTTKADKVRTVELSRATIGMLRRRARDGRSGRVFRDRRGREWTDHGFSGFWVRARRVAAKNGARPLKFHAWRHTWATWALAAGHDAAWCAAQIGDTLEVFLRRYAHAMPRSHRSLDFLDITQRDGALRADTAPQSPTP